jgi:serine/threonine-protein kinase
VIATYGKFEWALAEHYRFEDELGRGAMGVVYRAKDVRLGRPVAIKLLHPELTNELGAARFQSEIRIAAGLHHPNIIGLHDCGEADGCLYYVMDYLGGETLRARINREKQLSIEEALGIAEQIAEGLQYAHDHNVVHRDIKPENIILAEGRACLVDFGLARTLGDIGSTRLTASGVSIGTPHYLSPEQAAAEKEVGPRADQYALACVLYEMIAGESPFTGPTALSIAMRHVSERPRPLRSRRQSTPIAVDAAVSRALEKVPADRFATVKQFACALRTMSVAPRRVRRWLRSAVLPALLVIFATGAAAVYSRSRSVRGPGSSDTQRRIAVLYFDDNSAQHRLRYLADGLTESVITQLSAVQGISVVSRNGVRQFRDGAVSFDAMVRTLNVGSIVEGSLRASGDSIHVNVRLIDAESGTAVGSTTIVRAANDIRSLDDEVSSQVSVFLRRRLAKRATLDARPTTRG